MNAEIRLVRQLADRYQFSVDAVLALVKVYGAARAESLLFALKSPGRRYYVRVNTLKVSREEVTIRLREEGYEAYPDPLIPEAIYLPIRGPYRIRLLDKVVVADKAAAEAVYMGADLYAPGVVSAKGVREGDCVTIVSPRGQPVAEGVAFLDGDEMEKRRRGLAVKVLRSVYSVPSLRSTELYEKGLIYDQALPSMVAIRVLNPQPGWKVVDMCAAPGGKCTYAAQLMGDEGTIIAVDRSPSKVGVLSENCRRLGTKSIRTIVSDSRYLDLECGDCMDADAVILDPPCSAMGVRPQLYYERGRREMESLASYQRQFLKVAAKILREGGLLLYTTCTLTLEENEENVVWAVRNLPLRIKKQRIVLGRNCGRLRFSELNVQVFEPDVHDTPGFFISLMEKIRK